MGKVNAIDTNIAAEQAKLDKASAGMRESIIGGIQKGGDILSKFISNSLAKGSTAFAQTVWGSAAKSSTSIDEVARLQKQELDIEANSIKIMLDMLVESKKQTLYLEKASVDAQIDKIDKDPNKDKVFREERSKLQVRSEALGSSIAQVSSKDPNSFLNAANTLDNVKGLSEQAKVMRETALAVLGANQQLNSLYQ